MTRYEAEVAAGLAPISLREIQSLNRVSNAHVQNDSAVTFDYSGSWTALIELKTVIAVYEVIHFDVPRPKALLGHQNFQHLLSRIQALFKYTDRAEYRTFHISAAGSNSSVMQRIKEALQAELGIDNDDVEGDLLLRIRPTQARKKRGWEVLIRLTPRPLATRAWRVCNMAGALNASVAHAMVQLSQPTSQDRVLNIACGSGTLLIERLLHQQAMQTDGIDISVTALAAATANIKASGTRAQLLCADATQLPFASASYDTFLADLPFGQLVGSHQDNLVLYPALLREAARVAKSGARFVLISHEINLMSRLLLELSDLWQCREEFKITLSGLHPRIYVLERI